LSHLTFVYAYAGFVVWTMFQRQSPAYRRILLAHVPPLLTAAYLFLFFIGGLFIQPMAIGGGPPTTLFQGIVSTLSITAGGPLYGDGALAVALAAALVVGFALAALWRRDRVSAALCLTVILLAPAAVLALTGHALIYPRYFVIPIGFALILVGSQLGRLWETGRAARIGVIAILAAYLLGNGWWTLRLYDHGRGDYSRALLWMAEQTTGGPATLSSDHDFRVGLIYHYYAPRLGVQDRLHYLPQRFMPATGTGADFLIRHNFEGDPPYPNEMRDANGNRYLLERVFTHQSLTGYNWWVYRRRD
jgi:hypothetical protein